MKKSILYFFVLCTFIAFNSCSSDDTEMPGGDTCDDLNVSYSADISPIISGTCASSPSCHGAGSSQPVFESYSDVKPFADNGRLQVMVVDTRAMPQGTSLSQAQIDNFDCWLADGAPDN